MEKIVEGFQKGTHRLNLAAADNLYEVQRAHAEQWARDAVDSEVYDKAPANQQAALTVLAMATGQGKNLESAIDKIEAGDWDIHDHLVNVPEDRRKAALGFIRGMSHSQFSFLSLVQR